MSYGQVHRQSAEQSKRQIDAFVAAVAENQRIRTAELADERAATRAAMSRLSRMWMHVLAYLRLSKAAVCLMSTDARDYHDWPDGHIGQPAHFAAHRCTRCGKVFTI